MSVPENLQDSSQMTVRTRLEPAVPSAHPELCLCLANAEPRANSSSRESALPGWHGEVSSQFSSMPVTTTF